MVKGVIQLLITLGQSIEFLKLRANHPEVIPKLTEHK